MFSFENASYAGPRIVICAGFLPMRQQGPLALWRLSNIEFALTAIGIAANNTGSEESPLRETPVTPLRGPCA